MTTAVRHRTRAMDIPPRTRTRPQGTRKMRRLFRADVDPHIQAMKAATQSQQLDDPFRDQYGAQASALTGEMQIIEPPFNFSSLLRLPRENNMLRQCIDAMDTNVEGHGWRLEYVGPENQEESAAAKAEFEILDGLLKFPNDEHGLQELREHWRCDLETLGNALLEIGRDRQGRVVFISHVPAHTVRLTQRDRDGTEVRVMLPRPGQAAEQTVTKTFRRYVQIVGTRKVYFKEFGDPRPINPKTGRVDETLGQGQSATELIHSRIYSPGTPYGIPRWINQMPAILGSRQAELTNLDFFKENAIPAMALLVSGGMVTQSTLDEIEEQFLAARGRESMNRILIIEVHGDEEASSRDGVVPTPRLELKSMQNERQKDALFQEYDKNNAIKVRSSFRIPPVFVGLAQDYTHATAKTSFEVAESQVFGPERAKSDDMWNLKILGSYNPKFWHFRSLPPRITDPDGFIEALRAFDEIGAMTPNTAIGLANEVFDLEIPIIKEEWGNFPFEMVTMMAQQGITVTGFENLIQALPEGDDDFAALPDDDAERAVALRDIITRNMTKLRAVLAEVSATPQTKSPRRRTRKRADANA